MAEGADAGASASLRQTVEAARTLIAGDRAFVTPKQLEGALKIGRSATYDRVKNALKGGYLADESSKDERGMRLVIGSPLPGDSESYLPTAEDVVRSSSSGHPDSGNAHGSAENEALSGSPGRPGATGDDNLIEVDVEEVDRLKRKHRDLARGAS